MQNLQWAGVAVTDFRNSQADGCQHKAPVVQDRGAEGAEAGNPLPQAGRIALASDPLDLLAQFVGVGDGLGGQRLNGCGAKVIFDEFRRREGEQTFCRGPGVQGGAVADGHGGLQLLGGLHVIDAYPVRPLNDVEVDCFPGRR